MIWTTILVITFKETHTNYWQKQYIFLINIFSFAKIKYMNINMSDKKDILQPTPFPFYWLYKN